MWSMLSSLNSCLGRQVTRACDGRTLRRVKRESDSYQDLLSELPVELDWLKMKAEAAADAIDDESLPEDD